MFVLPSAMYPAALQQHRCRPRRGLEVRCAAGPEPLSRGRSGVGRSGAAEPIEYPPWRPTPGADPIGRSRQVRQRASLTSYRLCHPPSAPSCPLGWPTLRTTVLSPRLGQRKHRPRRPTARTTGHPAPRGERLVWACMRRSPFLVPSRRVLVPRTCHVHAARHALPGRSVSMLLNGFQVHLISVIRKSPSLWTI